MASDMFNCINAIKIQHFLQSVVWGTIIMNYQRVKQNYKNLSAQ